MLRTFQLKGRVRNLKQRRQHNLNFDTIDPQDVESFDLEFSPMGQLVRETQYTFRGSVHRTDCLDYDEAGKHVRTISYDSFGREADVTDHDYDESGKSITSTTHDIKRRVFRRSVYLYSGERLSTELIYEANVALRRQKDYRYEGGKLSQTVSRYFNPDGTVREEQIASFGGEGRILFAYGLTASGKPLGDGKYLYEYDAEGRESRRIALDEFDAEKPAKCEEVSDYSSDELGNWVRRCSRSKWLGDSDWTETITLRTIEYYS
jgi:hypothetical protein